ncbi:hypothetical protein FHL15_009319 [Xylaria flabelliformis]|uniref:RRM domain-containing protein n=1 Tax=Xylaria flabelliformis TaxID=2512241 RepID=A0A553HP94_9PEZI|nr:hypothetical protein FHL15_009319 [Xylaria flabelliformis]
MFLFNRIPRASLIHSQYLHLDDRMSPTLMNNANPSINYPKNNYNRQNLPPVSPADQNPPCNTLYVTNLPIDTSEEELKAMFQKQRGYKRLCFRTKQNGPMCFVEFMDIQHATHALHKCYGETLHNSTKGGIRLSFSKNPLGIRSGQPAGRPANDAMGSKNGIMESLENSYPVTNRPPTGLVTPSGLETAIKAEAEAKEAAAKRAVKDAEWGKDLEGAFYLKTAVEARKGVEGERAGGLVVSGVDYSDFDVLDQPRGGSRGLRFSRRSLKNTTGLRHLEHVTISKDNTADENLRRSASFAFLGSKLAICHEARLKSKSNQATLPTPTPNEVQATLYAQAELRERFYLCTHEGCERAIPGKGFPRQWNLRDHLRRVHDSDHLTPYLPVRDREQLFRDIGKSDAGTHLPVKPLTAADLQRVKPGRPPTSPIPVELWRARSAHAANSNFPQPTELVSSHSPRSSSIPSIAFTPRSLWRPRKRTRSPKLSSNMKPVDRWRPRISSQPISRSLQTYTTDQPGSLFLDRSSIDSGTPSADAS